MTAQELIQRTVKALDRETVDHLLIAYLTNDVLARLAEDQRRCKPPVRRKP